MVRNILVILFLHLQFIYSQTHFDKSVISQLQTIPKEYTYVHVNNSLFLTGEYLYYSIYCFSEDRHTLTEISKAAYVELVSKNKTIFKHKIKLSDGVGNGDFFIPTTVPSGSYKLLGYTQWMQNGPLDNFFQADIHIVNPYRVNKAAFTKVNNKHDSVTAKISEKPETRNSNISIDLNQTTFKKRSPVTMTLLNKEDSLTGGYYSISIRKKNTIPSHDLPRLEYYFNNLTLKNYTFKNDHPDSLFLPELRGELFSGRVLPSKRKKSLKDISIAISVPGENPYFTIAKTNKSGIFFFNINDLYSGNEALLQAINDNDKKLELQINSHRSPDYSQLKYTNIPIDSTMRSEILERSIQNQIENSYFKYKPDSILAIKPKEIFEKSVRKTYVLEDFTKFKTIRETIFEVVKDVVIRRVSKNKSVLRVKGYNFSTNSLALPLILLDGVFVQDVNELLDMPSVKIRSISVLRDQFIIGPKIFQGAILVNSVAGQIEDFTKLGPMYKSKIFKSLNSKKYFKQSYDSSKNSTKGGGRIPDDRNQLLWIPCTKIKDKEMTINFYTSDISGEFEISVEGFSNNGQPVSIQKRFYVKK